MGFVMNKNVLHKGKAYNKGAVVEQNDPNFPLLSAAGHLDGVAAELPKSGVPAMEDKAVQAAVEEKDEATDYAPVASKPKEVIRRKNK